jgi:purine-nucleoside phosphorylase
MDRRDLPGGRGLLASKVGLIFSSDSFYNPRPELTRRMVEVALEAMLSRPPG